MDFEYYAAARDFFYLSALLLGAGAGCVLNRYRRRSTARFRNRSITAAFLFFSGAVIALTAALIFSKWMILKEFSLYPLAGIVALVLILAFRFPRALGFPFILATGVFVVWLGYNYLRFPVIDDTLPDPPSVSVSFPPHVPLVGGVMRGYITEIPDNNIRVAP